MCGILGFVDSPWAAEIDACLERLSTRGPDAKSIYRTKDIALGHARLSVIDLQGGSQPMQTADGRYVIVFNGEIYNSNELRINIEKAGRKFLSTHSDTEVLLLGYEVYGRAILDLLDGMFAFVVWDNLERKLFAARDKFGIKPFFYTSMGGGFIFSSTMSPILELKNITKKLNPIGLRDYLAYQTVLAPHTIVKDIYQLPPANYLEYDTNSRVINIKRWWTVPPKNKNIVNNIDTLDRIDEAIAESVRRQIVSDVPLGAFLSGGVDSSLMIYYMSKFTSQPINAFTLRYEENNFDESKYASLVAEQFNCKHHFVDAPSINSEYLVKAIQDLDQPLADPAYVMTYALSESTSNIVKVAISGDGGDEIFGGYPRYTITEDDYPTKWWHSSLRQMIDNDLLPGDLSRRVLSGQEMVLYKMVELGKWRGRKSMQSIVEPELYENMDCSNLLASWQSLVSEFGGTMDSDTLMRTDLWTYLSENCLMKTDRASMAHGLEIRVPLLGEPVLLAGLQLPSSVHFSNGLKTILNGLAQKYLPSEVWNRPKHGFSVPLSKLFNGAWQQVIVDYFNKAPQIAPFLNQNRLKSMLFNNNKKRNFSNRKAYSLLVLLIWLDKNKVSL